MCLLPFLSVFALLVSGVIGFVSQTGLSVPKISHGSVLNPGKFDGINFVSEEVRNSYQCWSLCLITPLCEGSDFDVRSRICNLYSSLLLDKAGSPSVPGMVYQLKDEKEKSGACEHGTCGNEEICVATNSGETLLCIPAGNCGSPPHLANLTHPPLTRTTLGTEFTYTCDLGYNKTGGHGVVVCRNSGAWSLPSLQCQVVECSNPPQLLNMDLGTVVSTTYNSTTLYNCALGYNVTTGDGVSICQHTGIWSTPTLVCDLVECCSPPQLSNMDLGTVVSTTYNSTTLYNCAHGYNVTTGVGVSTCQHTGIWSTPTLVCDLVECSDPPQLLNMDLGTVVSTTYNSTTLYNCALGYNVTTGDGVSTCQHTGIWSTPTLVCDLVECGEPPQFSNMDLGTIVSMTYNSTTLYNCALGYYMTTGDGDSTCLHTGIWSTPTLVCDPIPNLITSASLSTGPVQLTCRTKQISIASPVQPCEEDEILVGCSTTNKESGDKGVEIVEENGKASCKLYHVGEEASARCCKVVGLGCEYLRGGPSLPVNDKAASLTCYKDFSMLGCGAYILDGHTDGVVMTTTSCKSYRGGIGPNSVFAAGVCCTAPGLSCQVIQSSPSISDGELMRVRCSAGQVMTGCTGHNYWLSAHGSYISDVDGEPTCNVVTTDSRTKVYVICCTV